LNLPPSGAFFSPNIYLKLDLMPRYFFNIRDGYDVDEDEEGIELPDLEAARAEALATVEELRDELADAGNIELEITDETGRRLLTVPFFRNGQGGRRR